jgi:putative ABC transport system permease protein
MHIPLRAGRAFVDGDGPSAPPVAIVNETAARRFWPERSPIGEQIDLPISRDRTVRLTVVGVVATVKQASLEEAPRSEIYVSARQAEFAWPWAVLVVRTAADPVALAEPVKSALHAANANVPIVRVNSLEEVIARSIAEPRLYSTLFAAFAALALVLAAVGLYGLVSYAVAQRTQELGVRLALGASPGELVRLVLGQGLQLAAVGAALGLGAGLAATRVLVALTPGIEPSDPIAFVAVTVVLLGSALAASYIPARRAARVDPVIALRSD